MPVIRTVEPATEPITLAEAKAHARVDVATDDSLITALIVAARNVAENELQRAIISQTWKLVDATFPDGSNALDLPFPTLQSVTSVKYWNTSGVQITLTAGTDYYVDTVGQPGQIVPVTSWPATYARPDAVEVVYVAGWANAAAVPQSVKQWMLLMVATMYDSRHAFGSARDAESVRLPFVDHLLDPYRVWVL